MDGSFSVLPKNWAQPQLQMHSSISVVRGFSQEGITPTGTAGRWVWSIPGG